MAGTRKYSWEQQTNNDDKRLHIYKLFILRNGVSAHRKWIILEFEFDLIRSSGQVCM